MYFVHPQIKVNTENSKRIISSFWKGRNKQTLPRIKSMFPEKGVFFTDMGRSAFKLIIEKFNLQNSQMLLPAYTCDIFLPIFKKYNISPIFLDIDSKTFNIELEEIKRKITSQTKSILVCHTYGLPIDIQKIKKITYNHLLIIEDCAHTFGLKLNEKYLGNSGDVSFFSLYKQFPTSRGGMLICPPDWQISLKKTSFGFRDFISFLNYFSLFSFLFKKFGSNVAPKIMRKEKKETPSQLNRVSFNLFSSFSKDFEQEELKKRVNLALFFQQELEKLGFETQDSKNNIFTLFSALVPESLSNQRDKFVKRLRKKGIFCTRIWKDPIILNLRAQKKYNIDIKDFPNTINASERIINFPLQNYYTKKDIKKIINVIKSH